MLIQSTTGAYPTKLFYVLRYNFSIFCCQGKSFYCRYNCSHTWQNSSLTSRIINWAKIKIGRIDTWLTIFMRSFLFVFQLPFWLDSIFDFSCTRLETFSFWVSTCLSGLRKIPNLRLPRRSLIFHVSSMFSLLTRYLRPRLDPDPILDLHIPGSFMIGSGCIGKVILHGPFLLDFVSIFLKYFI